MRLGQLVAVMGALLLALSAAGLPIARLSAAPPPAGLHLRVVAHSDGADDQRVKGEVRDLLQETIALWAEEGGTGKDLAGWVAERLGELEEVVDGYLRMKGLPYRSHLRLEAVRYPEERLGGITLPEGVYPTLLAILGDGQGHNWWGVLFSGWPKGAWRWQELSAADQARVLKVLSENEALVAFQVQDDTLWLVPKEGPAIQVDWLWLQWYRSLGRKVVALFHPGG